MFERKIDENSPEVKAFRKANPGAPLPMPSEADPIEDRESAMYLGLGLPTTGLTSDRLTGGSVGGALRGVKTIVGSPCTPTTTCGGYGCSGSTVIYK